MRRTASLPRSICSFNTDDGIRRATIMFTSKLEIRMITFQYRQRYQEGYNHSWHILRQSLRSFNTDNGIRRATI